MNMEVAFRRPLLALSMVLTLAPSAYANVGASYSASEVRLAAEQRLARLLDGRLHSPDARFGRVKAVFDRLVAAVRGRRVEPDIERIDWALYLPQDRRPLAYSTGGGKIVVTTGFLDTYRPDHAQLAFILGHEMAHSLCEHERERLSWVLAHNGAPLQALHAIEALETEPWIRDAMAPLERTQERVADRLGLELAVAAGFTPADALTVFTTMARTDRARTFGADVHDAPGRRAERLRKSLRYSRGIGSNGTRTDEKEACRPYRPGNPLAVVQRATRTLLAAPRR